MGTAMSIVVSESYSKVLLAGRDIKTIERIKKTRINDKYLPHVHIPENITPVLIDELGKEVCEDVLLAVPSRSVSDIVNRLLNILRSANTLISVIKGFVQGVTVHQYIEGLVDTTYISLMGPSYASQLAHKFPTVFAAASENLNVVYHFCKKLPSYVKCRVYKEVDDIELAAVLKGIGSLATGYIEGMGLGKNLAAYIIGEVLRELISIGKLLMKNHEILFGPAFLGDYILTAFDLESRNTIQGLFLSKLRRKSDIISEGLNNLKQLVRKSQDNGYEPVILKSLIEAISRRDPSILVNTVLAGTYPRNS